MDASDRHYFTQIYYYPQKEFAMRTRTAFIATLTLTLSVPAPAQAFQLPDLSAAQAQIHQSINTAFNHAQTLSSSWLPSARPVRMTPQQRELIDETNRYRISQGRRPLTPTAYLNGTAQNWANTMARTGAFVHNPAMRARTVRVNGENIYMMPGGFYTPQSAVNSWINSPGHRKNMLNPRFSEIGVGIATAPDGTTYAVQNFS